MQSVFEKLEDQILNTQNRSLVIKSNHIYETYKNILMPHGHYIYAKAYDMVKATMCAYTRYNHVLSHCKCVMWWCAYCTFINLPDQEIDNQYSYTTPSIWFYIYYIIEFYTDHSRISLKYKKICRMCKQ